MEPGQTDSTILCHNTDYSLQDMPTAPSVSCVLRDRPVRTKDKTIYVEIDRDCRAVTLENKLLAVTVLPEKDARTFTDGSGNLVWGIVDSYSRVWTSARPSTARFLWAGSANRLSLTC